MVLSEKTFLPKSPEKRIDQNETILELGKVKIEKKLEGTANVVEFVKIEGDGEGIFKPKSGENRFFVGEGTFYKRERAAFVVDSFLGFDIVPPTVIRSIEDEVGSLQKFIPNYRSGEEIPREEKSPSNEAFMMQAEKVWIFDVIINNTDRHEGNYIFDEEGRLWAIDHGCSFGIERFREEPRILSNLDEIEFHSETVQKVGELAESKEKKDQLFNLLAELLNEGEAKMCIVRLELIAKNLKLKNRNLSKDDMSMIKREIEEISESVYIEMEKRTD